MDTIETCGFSFVDEGDEVWVACQCEEECDCEFTIAKSDIHDFCAALLAFVEAETTLAIEELENRSAPSFAADPLCQWTSVFD